MPKVTQEYIDNKKKRIVDAALAVCKTKTLSSLTMQDIITQSGLSQGGIYHFYRNIDEILTDLLDLVRAMPDADDRVEALLQGCQGKMESARNDPDKARSRQKRRALVRGTGDALFALMADCMREYLFPYFKIEFEYNVLINNYPERAKRIYAAVKHPNIYTRANGLLLAILQREIADGCLDPLVSMEEYFAFNTAVYDGILKQALARNCYERNVMDNASYSYDFDARFRTMAITSHHLLGLDGD